MTNTQFFSGIALSLMVATAARAQITQQTGARRHGSDTVVAVTPASAPPAFNAAAGVARHASSAAMGRVPMKSAEEVRTSQAMMIVGGAALITGAVIGGKPGTIFMVGGGVVGLFGLYRYLR
jgi:hypothetical protein